MKNVNPKGKKGLASYLSRRLQIFLAGTSSRKIPNSVILAFGFSPMSLVDKCAEERSHGGADPSGGPIP